LFRVSINQYYDLCRKEKKHPEISIDQEYFMNRIIEDEDMGDFFIKKEESKYIKEILESLSNVSKNLLLLKYGLDLSYKEIAEIVDVKQGKILKESIA
jgi:RNA polymerase sigma-70 factor (ECF subfamily)